MKVLSSWVGCLILPFLVSFTATAMQQEVPPPAGRKCALSAGSRTPICRTSPLRVLILGSSTAAGSSASEVSRSWAGLLADRLKARNIETVNVSIGGSGTADSIARFEQDVVPYNPDFVVLATSLLNEQFVPDPLGASERFRQNTARLVRMVENAGAVPILVTPYPNGYFTTAIRPTLLKICREFEAEGVPVWDFLNTADRGDGNWIDGLTSDGTHPNDAGHLSLFETIPLGLFDYMLGPDQRLPPRQDLGSWIADDGDSSPSVSLQPTSPIPSWSTAFWTRSGGDDREKTLLEIPGSDLWIRRTGEWFEVLQGDQPVITGIASGEGGFQHVCLTYQKLSGLMILYLNGVASGAANVGALEPARIFALGTQGERPGIQGDSMAEWLTYRTPLCAEDVQELTAGRKPVKSLEAHLPLSQSPARHNQNAAPTIVEVIVGGSWHWVSDGPGRMGPR